MFVINQVINHPCYTTFSRLQQTIHNTVTEAAKIVHHTTFHSQVNQFFSYSFQRTFKKESCSTKLLLLQREAEGPLASCKSTEIAGIHVRLDSSQYSNFNATNPNNMQKLSAQLEICIAKINKTNRDLR